MQQIHEANRTAELTPFDQDVMRLASVSHNAWRSGRRLPDGSYNPRPKSTKDEAWTVAHDGLTVVDIANTDFPDLPADWQEESKASARVALREAYQVALYGVEDNLGDSFMHYQQRVDDAGNVIHIEWLGRNHATATKQQRRAFARLSADEQQKDADIYVGAVEFVNKRLQDDTLVVPDDILLEWLSADRDYLRKTYPDGKWLRVGRMEYMGDGRVSIGLSAKTDGLELDGIYPLAEVARLMRGLR
ncbi:MAG TPA: hypothetical protein VLF40_06455, partial [Candidatus Saccharimonadales bacterium]|nr:hypothetical protein [Candidatus Saccharimonadales bacterium]